ncbi:hypothetical protein RvY_16064 [Ramazzottius varieornatus]|uniref:Hexosyltransferase n=1 Tax=Ramazzottius varieornatus TaxID=947166 RepID=A0A1D1W3Q3_RAMVA|nr:hypothetical protein RvY_16064 [Ramazzottius varieornatus]
MFGFLLLLGIRILLLPTSEVSTNVTSGWPYKPIFLINEPVICSNINASFSIHLNFLIYIHSSPANADRLLILGHPDSTAIQTQVDNESRTFHDIVQADFKDSYKNLTFKEIAALYWASTCCPEATFVVKADDDLIIKPWLLRDTLRNHLKDSTKPMLFCKRCVNDYVHRDKKSKWLVPLSCIRIGHFRPFVPDLCA